MTDIPEEIIRNRKFTFHDDTDSAMLYKIKEYNSYMQECRIKIEKVKEAKTANMIISPLLIAVMSATLGQNVFRIPWLGMIILLVYAVVYVLQLLNKCSWFVEILFKAMLIILDLRFVLILALDVCIFYICKQITSSFSEHPAYPSFTDIRIEINKNTLHYK